MILEKNNLPTAFNSLRVNQILHQVDNLICTPKNSNHLRPHLRAIMALDHRRSIRPGKKIRPNFFAFDQFTLQNLANKSGCV